MNFNQSNRNRGDVNNTTTPNQGDNVKGTTLFDQKEKFKAVCEEMLQALLAHDEWIRQLVSTTECWSDGSDMPRLTQPVIDQLVKNKLQQNDIVSKAKRLL